MKLQVL